MIAPIPDSCGLVYYTGRGRISFSVSNAEKAGGILQNVRLIRLSVRIKKPEDIICDLPQVFEAAHWEIERIPS